MTHHTHASHAPRRTTAFVRVEPAPAAAAAGAPGASAHAPAPLAPLAAPVNGAARPAPAHAPGYAPGYAPAHAPAYAPRPAGGRRGVEDRGRGFLGMALGFCGGFFLSYYAVVPMFGTGKDVGTVTLMSAAILVVMFGAAALGYFATRQRATPLPAPQVPVVEDRSSGPGPRRQGLPLEDRGRGFLGMALGFCGGFFLSYYAVIPLFGTGKDVGTVTLMSAAILVVMFTTSAIGYLATRHQARLLPQSA